MGKIFITGATGTNGKALVKNLIEKQTDFVVGSRNPDQVEKIFGKAVAVRQFDFGDPTTFEAALQDVDKVFLLGPPLMLKVDELLNPFLNYLKSKSILRVVYFSALAADKMGGQLDFHTKIEKKLADEDFDFTILKPSFFSQNFKNYESENILERGIVFMPAGDGKAGFIDVDDIAAVAAEVLTSDQHSGKIYELTGPELLSYHEVATILSDVLGKPIHYPNPDPEQFKQVLEHSGAPDFIGEYLSNVYQTIAKGNVNFLTKDVELVTGRKPTSLKVVLERDFKIDA